MTPKEQQLIDFAHYLNTHPLFMALFVVLGIWALIWKGFALWKAARTGRMDWFVLLLIVNTVGILEMVYLFFFARKQGSQSNQ
jgi:hypothetical protein